MKNSHSLVTLQVFILVCMFTAPKSAPLPSFENETDHMALLDFKRSVTKDPCHIMSSWNQSIHFCNWTGVTCHASNNRVVILNLEAQELEGSLPSSIGNLTYLTTLNLTDNKLHGRIPQELGRLPHLEQLNLLGNSFQGNIPANISHCFRLRVLDLGDNELTGPVPDQLSSLLKLTHLWLDSNSLTGSVPPWLGNFSSLYAFSLGENKLQGSIPSELGGLPSLRRFVIASNNLSGKVPSSIYNFSSLNYFTIADKNHLHGELPPNVGMTLSTLKVFAAGINNFTGNIPLSFSNASGLQLLDLAKNSLTGKFPAEHFGSLAMLLRINFDDNSLGSGKDGDLNSLSFLANCTRLKVLSFLNNRFGGEIPESIGNLSTKLIKISLSGNFLHGIIPRGIGNLINLTQIGLANNNIGDSLPEEIGKLQKIESLFLNNNKLSGAIPSSLGNLTSLTMLYMQENRFEGNIPPSLGSCKSLLLLNLSSNSLNGPIPKGLVENSQLSISLSLSHNNLNGSLPDELGKLVQLTELDVSSNRFSGMIPSTLGSCVSLERLHLEDNELEGTIPNSFKNLRGLGEVDISRNNLIGKVPEFFSHLKSLKHLNISYNHLEGELLKEGIFSNPTGVTVLGNQKLCGGIPVLLLPACSSRKTKKLRLPSAEVMIPLSCVIALTILVCCFIAIRSMAKRTRGRSLTARTYDDWKSGVSYTELYNSTDGFSISNLIGSGSFGSVYKGFISGDGTVVAVKVLNLQQHGASKSFIDECRALRSIRHRNLLKIITACSRIDNQGNDFKSLVFEFMEKGSLDSWLHPSLDDQTQRKRPSFIRRLDIAIDVASAIEYLHHYCEQPIVHCDLKPNNVLLDEDMVAHVGDFGLARILLEASDEPSEIQNISDGLKGSIGYIPPEYCMGGKVSISGDIYSFGILLLEMFTGRSPTDEMFKDDLSIHQVAARAIPDHVMDIVDPSLLIERDEEDDDNNGRDQNNGRGRRVRQRNPELVRQRREECLVSVMHLGVLCSSISLTERMSMDVTVNKLKSIRDSYLKVLRR